MNMENELTLEITMEIMSEEQKTETSKTEQNDIEKADTSGKLNGRKWGLVGGIVLILLAVIVGIATYNTPANRLSRQLDLGNRFLEEQNYEQAAVAFEKVIEIDERYVEGYVGGIEAYIALGDTDKLQVLYERALNAVENLDEVELQINTNSVVAIYLAAEQAYPGDFEKIIDIMRKGYDITSKNADIGERLVQNYLWLAESYIGAGNSKETAGMIEAYEKAIGVLTEGFEVTGDQRLKEELDKIQGVYQKALEWHDYVSLVESILKQIAYYCQGEDYDRVFELMQSEDYEKVLARIEELEQVHRISTEYGEIGIYQVDSETYGHYMVYYGEYEGDSRQGHGVWLGYHEGINYMAQGTWEADVPQGDLVVREWYGKLADDVVMYRVISGNVADGLWDGNVEWKFEIVDLLMEIYPVSFENGKWIIIRREGANYIVSETNGVSMFISQEEYDELWGIVGFAYSNFPYRL